MPKLKKNTIFPTEFEDIEITGQAIADETLLTDEQLAEMKPISHFPELAALVKKGRPFLANPKKAVNIRLSPEVLTSFRATGRGWQTRIDNALRDWLKEHRP
jgi:uncharacterized protein (DUF4415 family)